MPLYIIAGPMYSSKTSTLLRQLTIYTDSAKFPDKPLLINHVEDKKRDSIDGISSHSSQMKGVSPFIDVVYASKLSAVDITGRNIIGIDESQFFDDLAVTVEQWNRKGLVIYCAGLNGDALCRPFGQLHLLWCIATEIQHLTAVCVKCLEESHHTRYDLSRRYPASFTMKVGGDPSLLIEAGAEDKYLPVCHRHHPCLTTT